MTFSPRFFGLRRLWLALAGLYAGATWAAPPAFSLPIQCRLGVDCFIQNYFDHDPGPAWRDYACGFLSYDGHQGTDFRLADLPAMAKGVAVVAAADGVVAAVRDGEPDEMVSRRGRDKLKGKDAGNGVRIRHGEGWETQYSHLRSGSIVVRPGQKVAAGEVLGQVGLSGNTDFPHVDFAVRQDGRPVDPFAPAGPPSCGETPAGLWDPGLAGQLNYQATGLLAAGFAPAPLSREEAEAGSYWAKAITPAAEALVFWTEILGLRRDDVLEMQLLGPDGKAVAANRTVAEGNKAVWFNFVGRKRSGGDWHPGRYEGRITLRREGKVVIEEGRSLELRP